jgi:hypothetical protein
MIMLSWITKIKLRTNGMWGHVRYTAVANSIFSGGPGKESRKVEEDAEVGEQVCGAMLEGAGEEVDLFCS